MTGAGLEDLLPLSPLQEGLLFHATYDAPAGDDGIGHQGASPEAATSDVYNVQLVVTLDGHLDPAALYAAGCALLRRHANLRAGFRHGRSGRPAQLLPREVELPWREVDLSGLDPADRAAQFDDLVQEEWTHRFDLAHPPALRLVLVRLTPGESRLVLTSHHILLDGWSTPLLVRELGALYATRGDETGLAPVTPYREYLAWLVAQDHDAALAAWDRALAGLERPTLLAATRSGIDAIHASATPVGSVAVELDRATTARLQEVARRAGVTVGRVVQGLWAVLLGKLTGCDDVVFGTTVAVRPAEIVGVENMVGLLINTVPVRVRLRAAEPLADALARLQAEQVALMDGQHLGLAEIQRRAGLGELFDTLLVFENQPRPVEGEVFAGVRIAGVETRDATHYPLTVVATPGERLRLTLYHRDDVFAREQVERIAGWLRRLFSVAAENPAHPVGRLDPASPAERARVLAWGDATRPGSGASLPGLFAAQVARTPDAPAVSAGGEGLSYAELDQQANRLAHLLAARGVGPERLVALALPRSADAVVAFLAVQKAGGACLPVDPDHPAQRLTQLLADAQPSLVLTTTAAGAALPDGAPEAMALDAPAVQAALAAAPESAPDLGDDDPHRAAYVVFTSGSTGRPKGVVVTHAGIESLIVTAQERLGVGCGARVAQFAALSFDIAVWELCMALLSGGCLVIVPSEVRTDVDALVAFARAEDLTLLAIPPSLLAVIPTEPGFPAGTTLLVGAEPVPAELVTRWSARNRFVVAYGVTEATVNSTLWEAPAGWRGRAVPIGRPDPGTRALVLDAALQPLPPGVAGELYLAGDGLARGYLHRPALTAERFVADPLGTDPLAGHWVYRTGDLARWLADGNLEFLGRADDQVQVRGFRVEPGEIESALLRHPGVAAAAVVARADGSRDGERGQVRLVAYVVAAAGVAASPERWRRHLAAVLPDYMMPSAFVAMEALPHTPHGKLDRAALPAPEPTTTRVGRAPRTAAEEVLTALVAEVLGLPAVGIDDDFFSIGGDSISSIVLVSRARRAGLEFTPRAVFQQRTVAGLARVARPVDTPPVEDPDAELGRVPITPIMAWLREHGGTIDGHNQSLLLQVPPGAGHERLVAVLQAILDHHAMLRARLRRTPHSWELDVPPPGTVRAAPCLVRVDATGGVSDALVTTRLAAAKARLDPDAGVMLQAVWFDAGPDRPGRLLCVVQHLVVDGVSWRILVPDLAAAWKAVAAGRTIELQPNGTSFRRWARLLTEEAHRPSREAELPLWRDILAGDDPPLSPIPLDRTRDTAATTRHLTLTLPPERTEPLLTEVPAAFHAGVNDVLLTALGLAVAHWRQRRGLTAGGRHDVLLNLEGHGREEVVPGADLSRTVGWFTSTFPVRIDPGPVDLAEALAGGPAAGHALKRVKEQLRALPDKGVGFGLLRYLNPRTRAALAPLRWPQIGFNYLGRFPTAGPGGSERHWAPLNQALSGSVDDDMPVAYVLEINVITRDRANGPELSVTWSWPSAVLPEHDVRDLAEGWFTALAALAAHVRTPGAGGRTASDLLVPLDQDDIEEFEDAF